LNSLPAAPDAVGREDSGPIERLAWHPILIAFEPLLVYTFEGAGTVSTIIAGVLPTAFASPRWSTPMSWTGARQRSRAPPTARSGYDRPEYPGLCNTGTAGRPTGAKDV